MKNNDNVSNVCQRIKTVCAVLLGTIAVGITLGASCQFGVYWTQRGILSSDFEKTDDPDPASIAPELPQTYATFDSTRVSIESHEQPAKSIEDVELFASQPAAISKPTPGKRVDVKGTVVARNQATDEDAGSTPEGNKAFAEEIQANNRAKTEAYKLKNDAAYRARKGSELSPEQKKQLEDYVEQQEKAIRDDHARRGIVESGDEKRFS